jgi:hypothetical protein
MSESCTVQIVNNSGRPLDAIAMWHSPAAPDPTQLAPNQAIILADNVAAGATVSGTAQLAWGTLDYWTCQVLYQGDGQLYVITGETCEAYKEFEVSDGTTVTFTLAAYATGTTNQDNGMITYSDGTGDDFRVLNPIVAGIANFVWEAGMHTATEGVAG